MRLVKFVCMSLREAPKRVYDTDLSDDAWSLIEPMFRYRDLAADRAQPMFVRC